MTNKTENAEVVETKSTNGILSKSKSFFIKGYHLALCNTDGSVSPVKCVITLAVVGYVIWFNPMLVLAFFELFIIFSFIWFMFKLLVGQDIVQNNCQPA